MEEVQQLTEDDMAEMAEVYECLSMHCEDQKINACVRAMHMLQVDMLWSYLRQEKIPEEDMGENLTYLLHQSYEQVLRMAPIVKKHYLEKR